MSILSASEVHFSYRTKYITVNAVRGISYSFETGKLYAITGPSGCGKSSFLSLLAGMAQPTLGSVSLDGTPLSHLDINQYRRESVSFIFQNFLLLPNLTVLENVMYPMQIAGITKKRSQTNAIGELLKVGITTSQLHKRPYMLSGGEQQRVAIARALASQSKFILADEPTGNLDSTNSQTIFSILQGIAHERDRCVILVTHDKTIAAKADLILNMKDGKLEE